MGQILGLETGVSVPSMINSTFGGTLTIVLIIILLMIFCGVGIFLYLNMKTFNKKIIVFENISGQGFQPVLKDKARLVKIGDGGEEILYLKKKKVYRTAYGKKMGTNTYWFAIGQDGYWYNIVIGDLDAKMGMLDIEPIDRDMRYMHVAIRKNIAERYRKIGFMEKYGAMMFNGLILIILIVGGWILIDQIGQLLNAAAGSMEAARQVTETAGNIMSKIDTICNGGAGITVG